MADAENTNFEFGIENFKPYADLQRIELGKITLIYGSNSSGKSSLLQSLLCIAQSFNRNTCTILLNGSLVSAGTFTSALNNTSKEDRITFEFSRKIAKQNDNSEFLFFSSPEAYEARRPIKVEIHDRCCKSIKMDFRKSAYPDVLCLEKVIQNFETYSCGLNHHEQAVQYEQKSGFNRNPLKAGMALEPSNNLLFQTKLIIEAVADEIVKIAEQTEQRQATNGMRVLVVLVKEIDINILAYATLKCGGWIEEPYRRLNAEGSIDEQNYLRIRIYIPDSCSELNSLDSVHSLARSIKEYYDICINYWLNLSPRKLYYETGAQSSFESIPINNQLQIEFSNDVERSNDFQNILREIADKLDAAQKTPIKASLDDLQRSAVMAIDRCKDLANQIDHLNNQSNIQDQNDPSNALSYIIAIIMTKIVEARYHLAEYGKALSNIDQYSEVSSLPMPPISEVFESSFSSIEETMRSMQKLCDDIQKIISFIHLASNLSKSLGDICDLIQSQVDVCKDTVSNLPRSDYLTARFLHSARRFFNDFNRYGYVRRLRLRESSSDESETLMSGPSYMPVFTLIQLVPEMLSLGNIIHLGPDRPSPKRSYTSEEIISNSSLSKLALWHNNSTIDSVQDQHDIFYFELQDLKIEADGLICKKSNDDDLDIYSIGTIKDGQFTNICDLGFGISQLMPVLIAAQQRESSTIFIQQPETHLHPSLQADVGDLIIKSVINKKSDTNHQDLAFNPKRWIIETHSHVLLLRILRHLREKEKYPEFCANDLKIYFVDKKLGEPAQIRSMKFNEDGELLSRWPRGFFSQESKEL